MNDKARDPRPGAGRGPSETRKIQLVGGSTYAVSLPKYWVEVLELSNGDEVLLQLRADGSVLLRPRRHTPHQLVHRTVDIVTNQPEELMRLVIGLYLSGVDVVTLKRAGGFPSALRAAVDKACQRLVGLQVVDETPLTVSLQDLADPLEFNMKKGVRMMHINARRMLQSARRILTDQPQASAAELEHPEAELDRLLSLVVKQHNRLLRDMSFSEMTGIAPEASLDHVLVSLNLERIGDYCVRIVEARPDTRKGIPPAIIDQVGGACEIALQCVDDSVAAFQRRDMALANATIANSQRLGELCRAVPRTLTARQATQGAALPCGVCQGYTRVFEGLERIGLYTKSVAEVAINEAVAQTETPGSEEVGP